MRWFGVLASFVMFDNSYGKGSIYFHFAKKRHLKINRDALYY
jgi:hypothetical protein